MQATSLGHHSNADLFNHDILSRDEERELFEVLNDPASREVDRTNARDKLAKHNLRLVKSIAYTFRRKYPWLDIEDLVSEGVKGLLQAIDGYDLSTSNKLSTYAKRQIEWHIKRFIASHSTTIRITTGTRQKIAQARHKLRQSLHREPTYAELSDYLHRGDKLAARALRGLRPRSLSTPISDSKHLGDLIGLQDCPDSSGPEHRELLHNLQGALETLNDQEFDVVIRRYGLFGNQETTLKDVGVLHGLKKERIRQIQKRAEEKLLAALSTKTSAR